MDLARHLEHTLLAATATPAEVERHCGAAAEAGLFGVCISPVYVALAKRGLIGTDVRVVTVVGFPLGTSTSGGKAAEARQAAAEGADELDMVMAIGLALGGAWDAVEADIRAVREATPGRVLKVILETGYLSDDVLRRAAAAAVSAGADFVKTSTGFGPRGASVRDIELLSDAVAGRAQVKASGGIRTAAAALELIRAGATRIGTSNGVELARAVAPP
jgi:deoxyribose-phosphate aldolase